jgi:peptidoglycan glycosyltransferase
VFTADRLLEMFTGKKSMGGNVLLSLRKQVQETAYTALLNNKTSEQDRRRGGDRPGDRGDPRSGVHPSYDPNPLVAHDFDAARAAFDKLDKDTTKPLLNRALQETFPPGSTFKVIVSAGAPAERPEPRLGAHRR